MEFHESSLALFRPRLRFRKTLMSLAESRTALVLSDNDGLAENANTSALSRAGKTRARKCTMIVDNVLNICNSKIHHVTKCKYIITCTEIDILSDTRLSELCCSHTQSCIAAAVLHRQVQ